MEQAKLGAAALQASDAFAAASHYTKALIEHPTSPDYFTQRATALSRLKPPRNDLALRDAEYAVLLGRKRQKREKIQAGQQRRVVALYGLGRYEEAKQILDTMSRWISKDSKDKREIMEHDMWTARVKSKLKNTNGGEGNIVAVPEYPDTELPDEKTIKMWLQKQLRNDGTIKLDDEEDTTISNATIPSAVHVRMDMVDIDAQDEVDIKAAKAEMANQSVAKPEAPKTQPVRHDWYQDTNSVTVTFYAKKVDKTKLQSDFTDDHIELSFPHPDNPSESFSFSLNPTFASIDATSSSVKAFGTKIELKLAKKEKGIKWHALQDSERPKIEKLPSAWTTKGDQDWDKKAAELTKKQSKKKSDGDAGSDSDADSEFGGDAVDGFFKKLYAGADEDTRRAMMKSFQESNGTALSTNWSEVGKGKVEEVQSKDK